MGRAVLAWPTTNCRLHGLAWVSVASNSHVNAGKARLTANLQPAWVGPGQCSFKLLCECGPSQADGHACSVDTKMAWSEHETLYFIELWGEDSIQVQIEGYARNKEVYVNLAEQMKEARYSRMCVQCLYKQHS